MESNIKKISYIVLALFVILYSAAGYAEDKQATVFSVEGDVKVIPKGRNVGIQCEEGMIVTEGDWIKTGPGAVVTLAFDEKAENVIKIEEDSLVIIKLDGYFKMQLLSGGMYAMLENVEEDDTFRVLTPSVVAESMSSGWSATSDGGYTDVVVFDDRVVVCGINKDGTVKKDEKYWIAEGYQRRTINFQDPGDLKAVPEEMVPWFKEQVVAHHLEKKVKEEKGRQKKTAKKTNTQKQSNATAKRPTSNTMVSEGEEINLLEYLYKSRLKSLPKDE